MRKQKNPLSKKAKIIITSLTLFSVATTALAIVLPIVYTRNLGFQTNTAYVRQPFQITNSIETAWRGGSNKVPASEFSDLTNKNYIINKDVTFSTKNKMTSYDIISPLNRDFKNEWERYGSNLYISLEINSSNVDDATPLFFDSYQAGTPFESTASATSLNFKLFNSITSGYTLTVFLREGSINGNIIRQYNPTWAVQFNYAFGWRNDPDAGVGFDPAQRKLALYIEDFQILRGSTASGDEIWLQPASEASRVNDGHPQDTQLFTSDSVVISVDEQDNA